MQGLPLLQMKQYRLTQVQRLSQSHRLKKKLLHLFKDVTRVMRF